MGIKDTKIWESLRNIKEAQTLKRNYLKAKKMSEINYESFLCEKYEQMMNKFSYSLGKKMDFENPNTFTQKQQWLKLYDQDERKILLSDKYAVRKYISDTIGEEYLFELISIDGRNVFEDANQICFDKLPNQFVIKCTHGSHFNIIVKNKAALKNIDFKRIKKQLNKWLKTNYAFVNGLELQYSSIKPQIIIEKYMSINDDLPDYKFCCFDGHIKLAWVDTNRFTNHKRTFFNPCNPSEILPVCLTWPKSDDIQIPDNYDKMIEIVNKLCSNFKFIRVDLYNLNGKIYFGELTFSSGSGYECPTPIEYDYKFGELINIDRSKRENNYQYRQK